MIPGDIAVPPLSLLFCLARQVFFPSFSTLLFSFFVYYSIISPEMSNAVEESKDLKPKEDDKNTAQEETGNEKKKEAEDEQKKRVQERDKKEMEKIEEMHKKLGVKLPVWTPSIPPRKTLVLDVDGTLVDSTIFTRREVYTLQ
jgi:hypothetical protein